MEADSFFPSEFTNYEYIYNNENNIAQLQVPLSISYFNVPKFANELYTDTDTTYFTYSGDWNSLIVSREKDGRYKNLSMRAYSGDSFKFYFSTGLGFSTGASYYSGPLTISGAYSKLTMYSGEADAITNAITFSAPTDNSVVYTLPFVENINWIRLHHKEAVSGESYRLYQFLPRTLIQVDDLEADVIDAVTIRVSGSIVVSADDLAPGSITGDKIMSGTVSGVLITPGTVTANEIAGGTITANKLNVARLSAITSNMGELFVTEKLEVTSGYLTAGIARVDNTGIKIGSSNTGLPAADALRIYGSGTVGNIVGMAFYNGSYSADSPQITIQADSTNALEIDNNSPDALTNINFTDLDTMGILGIYNGHLDLRIGDGNFVTDAGKITGYDVLNRIRYYVGPDEWKLNNAVEKNYFRVGQTSDKPAVVITGSGIAGSSASITLDNTSVTTSGQKQGYINLDSNNTFEITNQVTNGNLHLNLPNNGNMRVYVNNPATAQLAVNSTGASITGTLGVTGQTTLNALTASGTIGFGTSNNKFTVAAATGNTAVAGTLTSTGKFTASDLAYGTFTRTADLAITTAGTTITWQSSPRSNNITYSTTDITVGNTGYYLITGYFATLGNVSLRMTLQRSSANHTSIQQVTPLSTGGGYLFNFSNAVYLSANSVLKVILTPSANTTLNQNAESGAAPSPFIHLIQLAGI